MSSSFCQWGQVGNQLWTIVEKPLQATSETGQLLQHLRIQRFRREEGNQAHEGAGFEWNEAAIRCMQHIIEEAVFLIPQTHPLTPHVVEGIGDIHEVLEELGGDVLVGRLRSCQFQGDGHHVQAIHGHPGCPISLFEVATGWQNRAAVEDADVVQAQETAGKDATAIYILAVHPPGEVEQQFVENLFEEQGIGLTGHLAGDPVHLPRRPGVHRWVHIAKSPFISGELSVRVHVPLAHQQDQLSLGPLRVDHCHGNHVESKVPGGKPRILPLVGHRQHVQTVQVLPVRVPPMGAGFRWGRRIGVSLQPQFDAVVVELLAPQ